MAWGGDPLGLSVDLLQCDCRVSHPKGLGIDGRSHLGACIWESFEGDRLNVQIPVFLMLTNGTTLQRKVRAKSSASETPPSTSSPPRSLCDPTSIPLESLSPFSVVQATIWLRFMQNLPPFLPGPPTAALARPIHAPPSSKCDSTPRGRPEHCPAQHPSVAFRCSQGTTQPPPLNLPLRPLLFLAFPWFLTC